MPCSRCFTNSVGNKIKQLVSYQTIIILVLARAKFPKLFSHINALVFMILCKIHARWWHRHWSSPCWLRLCQFKCTLISDFFLNKSAASWDAALTDKSWSKRAHLVFLVPDLSFLVHRQLNFTFFLIVIIFYKTNQIFIFLMVSKVLVISRAKPTFHQILQPYLLRILKYGEVKN